MATSITSPNREMGVLFLVSFITRTSSIVVQSVAPFVVVQLFSFPASFVGYIIAAYWIANAIGTIVAMGVIKRPRLSTIIGFLITALSFAGLAYGKSPLVFGLFVALSGFGLAVLQAFLVPSMYFMGEDDRRHSGIGMYSLALSLGLIVGPLLSAALIHLYGFFTLFSILSISSIATLVASVVLGAQTTGLGSTVRIGASLAQFLAIFKRHGFVGVYFVNFLYSLLLPIFVTYTGVFARAHFDVSSSTALAMFTATFAVSSFLRWLYSRMRIRSFRAVLAISLVVLAASLFLIGTTANFDLFILGFVSFGVPHGLVYPSMTFVALERGGSENLVNTSYVFATSSGVAEFIAPLAAAPVIALYGLSTIFVITAIIPLTALGVLLTIPNEVLQGS
ncbi:MAG: MFS transporter [Nitrososphaerota archaeon]|nr:MFS transporter [Nitrososphaerota archaeon]